MPSQYINTINNLNFEKYNYGTIPPTPVAEQNQTYFAYFNGVGGTGPEYIDGTGYFIKYLIDTEGNIVNPEPFTVADSPQAVGLYNLLNTFETGKMATIKLIEPNPLYNTIPNSEILQGTHRIAHVGRIVPILTTETGEAPLDYLTTMSFQEITVTGIGSVSGRFRYNGDTFFANEPDWTPLFPATLTTVNPNNTWTNSHPNYIIGSGSSEANTRLKFNIFIRWFASSDMASDNYLYVQLRKNGAPIFEDSVTVTRPQQGDSPTTVFVGSQESFFTPYIDQYEAGDEFSVYYKVAYGGPDYQFEIQGADGGNVSNFSFIRVYQETPASSGLIDGVNTVYSPYFVVLSNFLRNWIIDGDDQYLTQEQAPYNSSILCFSPSMSLMYDSNYTQQLSPEQITMGFSEIEIPFSDIRRGDFIRFEYNKSQTYTITDVFNDFSPSNIIDGSFNAIRVTPNIYVGDQEILDENDISTLALNLQHFVIYRVINDGTYITLDVRKDAPGGAYTGIIQPEYTSKELVEKYDKIIKDLTEKEIIQ